MAICYKDWMCFVRFIVVVKSTADNTKNGKGCCGAAVLICEILWGGGDYPSIIRPYFQKGKPVARRNARRARAGRGGPRG